MPAFPRHPNSLVQLLREAQAEHGWLPRPLLSALARELGLTLAHVEGVASFYRFLHLQPVGRLRILFSDNITDRMLGSEALMADLCARLGVQPGVMRADGRVENCRVMVSSGAPLLIAVLSGLVVNLRILLGFAFLPAGLKKVLGQRFTEASNVGPFHDFLHAFYATGGFYRFVGVLQLVVATLLMTQTFGTLGALMALPIFTAITVLCWSTGAVFTGVMTTLMLLGTLLLCAWEYERFIGVLRPAESPGEPSRASSLEPSQAPVDVRIWRGCGVAVLLLYLVSCVLAGGVYRPRGLDLARPEFYVFPLIASLPALAWAWERRQRRQAQSVSS